MIFLNSRYSLFYLVLRIKIRIFTRVKDKVIVTSCKIDVKWHHLTIFNEKKNVKFGHLTYVEWRRMMFVMFFDVKRHDASFLTKLLYLINIDLTNNDDLWRFEFFFKNWRRFPTKNDKTWLLSKICWRLWTSYFIVDVKQRHLTSFCV